MIINAYVGDKIGEIIRDWDCIGIRIFSPDEYYDVILHLCDELSISDTPTNVARKIKRIFKQEFEDSFDVSDEEIKETASKITEVFKEFQ